MTPQEQDMLNDLVRKVNSASLQDKDNDAEHLLRDGFGRNPDAIYVLAQTVLVQNIALEQAKRQMQSMQQAPSKPTSFLGSLFGHNDPQPQAPPPPQQGYQTVQYQQPGQGFAPAQGYAPAASGQPSFLRSAATTAAGVAAGALVFQGVEGLLHGGGGGFGGFGGFGGGGGFDQGGFGGGAPREEVVNNYYGDGGDAGDANQGGSDLGAQDTSYGDDFTDGGGDFGGDDTNFS